MSLDHLAVHLIKCVPPNSSIHLSLVLDCVFRPLNILNLYFRWHLGLQLSDDLSIYTSHCDPFDDLCPLLWVSLSIPSCRGRLQRWGTMGMSSSFIGIFSYIFQGAAEKKIPAEATFHIPQGNLVVLSGNRGSGKKTVLELMAGEVGMAAESIWCYCLWDRFEWNIGMSVLEGSCYPAIWHGFWMLMVCMHVGSWGLNISTRHWNVWRR